MDIISNLYNQHGFDSKLIKKVTFGEIYIAVELQNGNIGVCATLKKGINQIPKNFDTRIFEHRVILQAYYNAMFNYDIEIASEEDIFTYIDFKRFQEVVMIGNFRPLVSKFLAENIKVSIFDLDDDSPELTPMNKQNDFLGKCDALIMSATTIPNLTFTDLLSNISKKSSVFILGPSSFMHKNMFFCTQIKAIFGTQFISGDARIHEAIAKGGGNKAFPGFSKKIAVKNKEILLIS